MKTADAEQLAALWVRAQPTVAAYIASIIPNFHDSNDVLQNVGMVVVRKREEYDAERPFVPWVIGIAQLEIKKFRRTAARDRLQFGENLVESLGEVYEEMSADDEQRRFAVSQCMEKLTGLAAKSMRLRYSEGLAVQEIAVRLATTPQTIKTSLYRARQSVHDCVERFLRRQEES